MFPFLIGYYLYYQKSLQSIIKKGKSLEKDLPLL